MRARLLWVVGALALVVATLMSLLVGHASIEQVQADKGLLMSQLAQQMADKMDQGVYERLREIQIVGSLDAIRDPGVSLAQKRALLEKVKATYANYAWIGFTDTQGNILVGTDNLLVGKNVGQRDWFVEGSKGPHVGDVHDAFLLAKILPKPKHDFLPLRLLDVSAPITDDQGRLLGVICGHLSWDWSFEVRNNLLDPLKAQSNADVLILNREGKILMGTPELAGLTEKLELPSVHIATSGGSGYLTETWPNRELYLTGYAASRGYLSYPGLHWSVLVRERASRAFAPAHQLQQQILAIGAGFALLFGIALWWVAGRLTRPVREITAAAERIGSGDTAAAIPLYQGSDEAAVLSAALRSMVTRLLSMNEQMRLAARVFDSSTEGIVITGPDERILSVNQALTAITGYSPEEVIGQRPVMFSSGRQDRDFYHRMWDSIRQSGKWQGEIWNRRKNGDIYPEWLVVTTVRDDNDEVSHYIGIFTDITERKRAEDRILYLAQHDGLTGLPNRMVYFDRLGQALKVARRQSGRVAVLFVDLDRFKNVNDSLGHDVGDAMLVEVAERLQSCVRASDTLARLGGDEFVVIMPDVTEPEEAAQLALRITEAVSRPYALEQGYQLNITSSIGISLFPDDASDVMTLTGQADTAMFHAKGSGRDNFQFFTQAMNEEVKERLLLENGLRHALENGELYLQYQPQFRLQGGAMWGVEALLRWHSPELGPVSPARFIPIAEDTGLINGIGEWVLREACRQFMAWHERHALPLRLAVNLSLVQFQDPNLPEMVAAVLAETGMQGQDLELEITESVLIGNEQQVERVLDAFHEMGIRIAIDDFGTGYSSLHYLKHLHIDTLKIDQSFVRDLGQDPEADTIVETIIAMGRSLRLALIAEGIENEQQLEFLTQRQCDVGQGFLLARPLGVDDICAMLQVETGVEGGG